MFIVKFNPNSTDSDTRYALQYSDKDFEVTEEEPNSGNTAVVNSD